MGSGGNKQKSKILKNNTDAQVSQKQEVLNMPILN